MPWLWQPCCMTMVSKSITWMLPLRDQIARSLIASGLGAETRDDNGHIVVRAMCHNDASGWAGDKFNLPYKQERYKAYAAVRGNRPGNPSDPVDGGFSAWVIMSHPQKLKSESRRRHLLNTAHLGRKLSMTTTAHQ